LTELLDRGLTLGQKYGGGKGWQLGLRFDESKPGEVMEFRE